MDFGYARVSTDPRDLTRQLDALAEAGIPEERVYADEAGTAPSSRPGLKAVLSRLQERLCVSQVDARLGHRVRSEAVAPSRAGDCHRLPRFHQVERDMHLRFTQPYPIRRLELPAKHGLKIR